MNCLKKPLLFSLLLSLPAFVQAQSNFKDAYIITNMNDTVWGQIDLRSNELNARECHFKQGNESVKIFLPGEIQAYRFSNEGNYFVSKNVVVDGEPKDIFLEYMVKGILNLYCFVQDYRYYYFIEDESGAMTVLNKKPDRIENGKVVSDNRYKGVIRYLFRDYDPIASNADNTNLDRKSMIEIVKMYHDNVCETGEECIQFVNKSKPGTVFKFSVYTGLQLSAYARYPRGATSFTMDNYSPMLGVQLSLSNPRSFNGFGFIIDASFANFNAETSRKMHEGSSTSLEYKYNVFSFSGRSGVKYTFSTGQYRPVLEMGYILSCLLGDAKYTTQSFSEHLDYISAVEEYDMKPRNHGFYIGAGLDYEIKSNHFLFFRINMEKYGHHDKEDYIQYTHNVKVGYTF